MCARAYVCACPHTTTCDVGTVSETAITLLLPSLYPSTLLQPHPPYTLLQPQPPPAPYCSHCQPLHPTASTAPLHPTAATAGPLHPTAATAPPAQYSSHSLPRTQLQPGSHSQYGHCIEGKKLSPLPDIEPRSYGVPLHSLTLYRL